MKKLLIAGMVLLSACTNLTMQEKQTLRSLKTQGITVDTPAGAALLNLLPGIGNFYLASGNGAQSEHALYGTLNLLTWPISILWGVPEGAVDAKTINERELIYYYTFDESGRLALEERGLQINNRGLVEKK